MTILSLDNKSQFMCSILNCIIIKPDMHQLDFLECRNPLIIVCCVDVVSQISYEAP